jgi:hypothetical protein
MPHYCYINKEWLVSPTARHIYRISALLSLMLFFMLWAVRMHPIPPSVLPIARALILAGVIGAATTMVAMEYFFLGFDNTPAWKKVFWFVVLAVPPLGPPVYCFVVYSRSKIFISEPSAVGPELK